MTGIFSEETPEKCEHYARFMSHLTRSQADVIFYGLFFMMIVLLIIASQMYTKASRTLSLTTSKPPLSSAKQRRIRIQCLAISLVCFLLGLHCTVFSALAGLHIQFCDGEDLIFFYWSFWSLIEVGSLIAILGISMNQVYSLNEKEQPPWNVALGTPVLVIAALGHAWQLLAREIWKRCIKNRSLSAAVGAMEAEDPVHNDVDGRAETKFEKCLNGCRASRASTIVDSRQTLNCSNFVRHIGYTFDNEPLFANCAHDSTVNCPVSSMTRRPDLVASQVPFVGTSAATISYSSNV